MRISLQHMLCPHLHRSTDGPNVVPHHAASQKAQQCELVLQNTHHPTGHHPTGLIIKYKPYRTRCSINAAVSECECDRNCNCLVGIVLPAGE